MRKSIFSLSFALGLAFLGFSQAAFAGEQTTTRTDPYGNSVNTIRTGGNGQLNTTRTGPYGNSVNTIRTVGQ